MKRNFCDRCGELIEAGKYATGSTQMFTDNHNPTLKFQVEVHVKYMNGILAENGPDARWLLCQLCCSEVLDQSNKNRVENDRAKEKQIRK